MTLQNNFDSSFSINSDGWSLAAGTTSRSLTVTGGDITITGANANVYTYPGATSTLASLNLSETFTANKLFSAGLNVSGGNLVVSGGTFSIASLATNQVLQYNGTNIVNATLALGQMSSYQNSNSNALSTVVGTTFSTKTSITTGTVPTGTYKINWSYTWYHSVNTSPFNARIQVNAATIYSHIQVPANTATTQRNSASGFYFQALTAGTQVITLQAAAGAAAGTAGIADAHLEITRIS